MKRVVTYDVKNGNNYDDFYALVEDCGATMLTESTYLFDTNWNQNTFESKMIATFNKGDNVHYISVDKENKLFTKKLKL